MRCAHWRRVPLSLVREARDKWSVDYVDGASRCQLSTHDDNEHYGLLDDTGERGTALWLRWSGTVDVELVVLADCQAVSRRVDGEGCCLFTGHAGQHTWEDTLEDA